MRRRRADAWNYRSTMPSWTSWRQGETITFTYTVTATDNHGGTDTDTVTITITGTNDAPTVSATAASGITEALDASAQDLATAAR